MFAQHGEVVRSGSAGINRWRAGNPNTRLECAGTDFATLDLTGADLTNGDFAECSFRGSNLAGTQFQASCLGRADFSDCNLRGANFSSAYLSKANFRGASIAACKFDNTTGLSRVRGLESTRLGPHDDLPSTEGIKVGVLDVLVPWQRLRTLGRLPLFIPSYVTAGLLITYFSSISFWNQWMERLHNMLIKTVPNSELTKIVAVMVSEAAKITPSLHTLLLLIATMSLGIGASLYLIFCPSRIQAFSIDEWEFSNGRPRIHYIASGWRLPTARIACALAYLVGGSVAAYLVIYNLIRYFLFIFVHLR